MSTPRRIRVAAVDDHPVLLRGLQATLATSAEIDLVTVSTTVGELLAVDDLRVDVVLLDVDLRDGTDPADNVRAVVGRGLPVVLYTSEHRAALVQRTMAAGALGLVLKGDPERDVVEAVQSAARGEVYMSSRLAMELVSHPAGEVSLSPREREVLTLLAAGLPWSAVAKDLGISVSTARTHMARVLEAYSAIGMPLRDGPREAVARALSSGQIDDPYRLG
ncbi:response regulator [Serinibacter arcticus]|uniref:response regulator n=1 Tax=Serinibacter arcticus TaxID=1655435 RepID=UPI0013048BB8|nr:response regulator transcription factor [Serinibacter arcticus]